MTKIKYEELEELEKELDIIKENEWKKIDKTSWKSLSDKQCDKSSVSYLITIIKYMLSQKLFCGNEEDRRWLDK